MYIENKCYLHEIEQLEGISCGNEICVRGTRFPLILVKKGKKFSKLVPFMTNQIVSKLAMNMTMI